MLTLLHSERPKLYRVLAVLSGIGSNSQDAFVRSNLPVYHNASLEVKVKPLNRCWFIVFIRSLSGGVKVTFSMVKSVSKLDISLSDF